MKIWRDPTRTGLALFRTWCLEVVVLVYTFTDPVVNKQHMNTIQMCFGLTCVVRAQQTEIQVRTLGQENKLSNCAIPASLLVNSWTHNSPNTKRTEA